MSTKSPRRPWQSSMTCRRTRWARGCWRATNGSSTRSMRVASGISAGLRTTVIVAVGEVDLVLDVGHRREQLEAVLALQALAHDVHVQQAEEAAAEAEAERVRGLGLVVSAASLSLSFSSASRSSSNLSPSVGNSPQKTIGCTTL